MATSRENRTPDRVIARFDDLTASSQIRKVALRLFGLNGSKATSLRSIAAEAGVSLGAVEHHFKSKAALQKAVAEDVLSSIHEAVSSVGAGLPVAEALAARRRAWIRLITTEPDLRAYVRRLFLEGDETSHAAVQLFIAEERAQLEALIEQGLARRPVDLDATVAVYFAMVNAAMMLGPVLKASSNIDVTRQEDIERLQRAEIDLLTRPLFPLESTPQPGD